ncbi:sigma-70 family RNA polymerase sigma factor [Calycomorphotria hydatis]|uniref:RNA polymerase sigma factor n=1 Tax=Calycomorphotria hydatis TaxID=2528027 RepID=A0A517T588_9PLAN|nr:sigma-70 family RNA polymerase sigma factor [Calycomorphotria hydatis]QDT63534.1 RNA polymerase sigma factor [Calycomorphotria hydatis]
MSDAFDRSITNAINSTGTDAVRREFLKLISSEFAGIHATVVGMVGNLSDADDVMQDACIKMWKNFDRFDRERSFRNWAVTIAANEARNFLKKRKRNRGFGLTEEAIENLVKVRTGAAEFLELRLEKLADCVAELSSKDQHLVWECYERKQQINDWATKHNKSANTVYSRLRRLRDRLYECINRKLSLAE